MKRAVDEGTDLSAAVRSFDAGPFLRCIDLREGGKGLPFAELNAIFRPYTAEIAKLIAAVDKLPA
jgi:hypothetical protein